VRTSTSGAVRSIHRRSEAPDAAAVVLLHGWPDSVLRFERLLPLLDDLHVVVPALPGYPFAETWSGPPTSTSVMAEAVAGVMEELGYERYVVSGGDIGSSVAEGLAVRHPARVSALHLTDVPYRHMFTLDEVDLTDSERTYLAAGRQWQLTRAPTPWSSPPSRARWPSGWAIPRPAWPRGSSRSCVRGVTAAVMWSRCFPARTC
jgi:pimeloyl-ACP methyl ester carboxylesterase